MQNINTCSYEDNLSRNCNKSSGIIYLSNNILKEHFVVNEAWHALLHFLPPVSYIKQYFSRCSPKW